MSHSGIWAGHGPSSLIYLQPPDLEGKASQLKCQAKGSYETRKGSWERNIKTIPQGRQMPWENEKLSARFKKENHQGQ